MNDRLAQLRAVILAGRAHLVDIVRIDHTDLSNARFRECHTDNVATLMVHNDEVPELSELDENHRCAPRSKKGAPLSYDIEMTVPPGPGIFETTLDLGNMTSNVAPLWRKACPDTDGLAGIDGKTGQDVAAHLRAGLEDMKAKEAEYVPLVRGDGTWGDYATAAVYLERVTQAAETHPDATFKVCR